MPFRSKAQQAFMFLKHPSIAKRWADKYGTPKNLPKHVKKPAKKPIKKPAKKVIKLKSKHGRKQRTTNAF